VPDLVRVRVVAHGHVQGVFFRESVRRKAEREGVAGWVRNRPDGSVEAAFEGAPDAVTVDRLERHDEMPEGKTGFSVG
jgi:acylphosphatase